MDEVVQTHEDISPAMDHTFDLYRYVDILLNYFQILVRYINHVTPILIICLWTIDWVLPKSIHLHAMRVICLPLIPPITVMTMVSSKVIQLIQSLIQVGEFCIIGVGDILSLTLPAPNKLRAYAKTHINIQFAWRTPLLELLFERVLGSEWAHAAGNILKSRDISTIFNPIITAPEIISQLACKYWGVASREFIHSTIIFISVIIPLLDHRYSFIADEYSGIFKLVLYWICPAMKQTDSTTYDTVHYLYVISPALHLILCDCPVITSYNVTDDNDVARPLFQYFT